MGAVTTGSPDPANATMPVLVAAAQDETADPERAIASSHTVTRGESAWVIAHRYGLTSTQLLERNGLNTRSVLRPGMVLTLADNAAP
jgi:membrane-bound lytic murein transglycosylase D